MQGRLRKLLVWLPFLFGVGFIAPLIAEGMAWLGWHGPFGLSRIACGLVIGASWGLHAVRRGRWL